MKKTILTLAMTTLLSTSAFASKGYEASLYTSQSVVAIALTAFAPAVAGGLLVTVTTGGTTLWKTADETVRKQVQQIVNNDAQQFYNDGSISPALANSMKVLQEENELLTDADAVDIMVEAVSNF